MDLEFNEDGSELWISSQDSHITIIETNQWHVIKTELDRAMYIKALNVLSAKSVEKMCRKKLTSLFVGITNGDMLVFLSEEHSHSEINLKPFMPFHCTAIKRVMCSPDCQMVALFSRDGIFKLYTTEFLICQVFQTLSASKRTPLDQHCLQIDHDLHVFDKKVSKQPQFLCLHFASQLKKWLNFPHKFFVII